MELLLKLWDIFLILNRTITFKGLELICVDRETSPWNGSWLYKEHSRLLISTPDGRCYFFTQFSIAHITEKIQNAYTELEIASFSTGWKKDRRREKKIFCDKWQNRVGCLENGIKIGIARKEVTVYLNIRCIKKINYWSYPWQFFPFSLLKYLKL